MMANALVKLSSQDLEALAASLRSGRIRSPFSAMALGRIVPPSLAAAVTDELSSLASGGFTGEQTALLLDALRLDRKSRQQSDDSMDLVTTGPESSTANHRDTGVVVREMFASASETVLLAGYAIYQGQSVFRSLAQRMEVVPGLRVQMYLDIQRRRTDTTMDTLLVRRFFERFRKAQWPSNVRLPELYYDPRSLELSSKTRSSLHAKCVVVDSQQAFISSANFTEAAQQRNIEVGLLVRSRTIAKQLEMHFQKLSEAGLLKPVFNQR